MTTRIWHQSMVELDDHPGYARALQDHAAAVLGSSAELVVHGLRPGTHGGVPPARTLHSPFAYHVLLRQVIEHFMTAEAEGFDAVVIGSYSEPFLRQARSAVDIPVVSMAESTLLTACSVATYSVLVTMSPEIAWMISQHVSRHALGARVAGVYWVEPVMDEEALSAAFEEPGPFVEAFTRAARPGIERFGDVVIPAEGIMNELLVAHGVREVEGVCVMDGNAVAWLHAEYMVKLRRTTGLRPGRRWDYARLDPDAMSRLRGMESR